MTSVALVATAWLGTACGSSSSGSGPVDGGGSLDGGGDSRDAGAIVAAPDLRFKWIGAGFALKLFETTNGGTGGPGTLTIQGPIGATPLDLTGEGSSEFEMFSTGVNLEPMVVIATTGSLPSVEDDLAGLLTAHAIVVSLDAAPNATRPITAGGAYNAILSGTESSQISYLPYSRGSFTAADFSAWVSSEGSNGRVVTALCPKDGALFATAFGRTGDSTAYETQVITTPLDGLGAQLATLAADGYFITALGRDGTGSEGAGGFIAVGVRVPGQTTARSIKIIDQPCVIGGAGASPVAALFDEGYALVGEIFHNAVGCDGSPTWAFIGER